MSGHPTLTTAVYIIIAVVFVCAVAYMLLYNRSVKSSKTDFINKGEMAANNQEAPNAATDKKTNSGQPGSLS